MDISNGYRRKGFYSEQEKAKIENGYIERLGIGKSHQNVGIQTSVYENELLFMSLKDSINFEKEFINLQSENELLKQRLYSRTLDQKQLSFKIEFLKDSIATCNEENQRKKAIFVEKFADWIFKFSNTGVSDMQSALDLFIKDVYAGLEIIPLMSENEMFEWVWKIYRQLQSVSGIRNRSQRRGNEES